MGTSASSSFWMPALSLSLSISLLCLLSVLPSCLCPSSSLTLHVLVHSFLSVSLSVFIPHSDHGLLSSLGRVYRPAGLAGLRAAAAVQGFRSMCSGVCPAPGCRCPPTSGATQRSWPRWCGDASCRSRPASMWVERGSTRDAAATAARPGSPLECLHLPPSTPEATSRDPGICSGARLSSIPWAFLNPGTVDAGPSAVGFPAHRSPGRLPPTPGLAALEPSPGPVSPADPSWVSNTHLCPVPHGAPQRISVSVCGLVCTPKIPQDGLRSAPPGSTRSPGSHSL